MSSNCISVHQVFTSLIKYFTAFRRGKEYSVQREQFFWSISGQSDTSSYRYMLHDHFCRQRNWLICNYNLIRSAAQKEVLLASLSKFPKSSHLSWHSLLFHCLGPCMTTVNVADVSCWNHLIIVKVGKLGYCGESEMPIGYPHSQKSNVESLLLKPLLFWNFQFGEPSSVHYHQNICVVNFRVLSHRRQNVFIKHLSFRVSCSNTTNIIIAWLWNFNSHVMQAKLKIAQSSEIEECIILNILNSVRDDCAKWNNFKFDLETVSNTICKKFQLQFAKKSQM